MLKTNFKDLDPSGFRDLVRLLSSKHICLKRGACARAFRAFLKRCTRTELSQAPHELEIYISLLSTTDKQAEAMTSRIPPLLEPYLALPPEASLILLTSVLGASTNWLVLRYLYSALGPRPSPSRDAESGLGGLCGGSNGDGAAVVLVSFLRDLSFWKEGGRRLVRFLANILDDLEILGH